MKEITRKLFAESSLRILGLSLACVALVAFTLYVLINSPA